MNEASKYQLSSMQRSTKKFNFFEKSKAESYSNELDKLSVSGEAAACLAHEFRNPMTSIKGFLQLIEQRKGSITEESLHRYCQLMIKEINQMDHLISDLLQATKPERSQFAYENLVSVVEQSIEQTRPTSDVKMVLLANKDLPFAKCIKEQMVQVLSHLLANAMSERRTVTVSIKESNSAHLKITITDCRMTHSPKKCSEAGNPINPKKDIGEWLDLMVSYNIVKNHEGNLTMYRTEEKGKLFEITLPLARY